MTRISGLAALVVLMAPGLALADDYPFLDGLTRYAERIDTVSVESGDAQDVNAAIQTVDPWPRNARNRRIPASGSRMVGAIERYQNPTAGAQPLAPIAPVTPVGGGGGGAGGQ